MRRIYDFLRQARLDLEAGRVLRRAGRHEWACFLFHQCGEKSVKAALEGLGVIERGHSIKRYLVMYDRYSSVPREMLSAASRLDTYFIASRHVTAYDMGIPADYFDENISLEAERFAEDFLEWAEKEIERQIPRS